MQHQSLLIQDDYERKLNYDWPMEGKQKKNENYIINHKFMDTIFRP